MICVSSDETRNFYRALKFIDDKFAMYLSSLSSCLDSGYVWVRSRQTFDTCITRSSSRQFNLELSKITIFHEILRFSLTCIRFNVFIVCRCKTKEQPPYFLSRSSVYVLFAGCVGGCLCECAMFDAYRVNQCGWLNWACTTRFCSCFIPYQRCSRKSR